MERLVSKRLSAKDLCSTRVKRAANKLSAEWRYVLLRGFLMCCAVTKQSRNQVKMKFWHSSTVLLSDTYYTNESRKCTTRASSDMEKYHCLRECVSVFINRNTIESDYAPLLRAQWKLSQKLTLLWWNTLDKPQLFQYRRKNSTVLGSCVEVFVKRQFVIAVKSRRIASGGR